MNTQRKRPTAEAVRLEAAEWLGHSLRLSRRWRLEEYTDTGEALELIERAAEVMRRIVRVKK